MFESTSAEPKISKGCDNFLLQHETDETREIGVVVIRLLSSCNHEGELE